MFVCVCVWGGGIGDGRGCGRIDMCVCGVEGDPWGVGVEGDPCEGRGGGRGFAGWGGVKGIRVCWGWGGEIERDPCVRGVGGWEAERDVCGKGVWEGWKGMYLCMCVGGGWREAY